MGHVGDNMRVSAEDLRTADENNPWLTQQDRGGSGKLSQ